MTLLVTFLLDYINYRFSSGCAYFSAKWQLAINKLYVILTVLKKHTNKLCFTRFSRVGKPLFRSIKVNLSYLKIGHTVNYHIIE